MIKKLSDLAPCLADEDKAIELFERLRWPAGPVCPHCREGEKIYKVKSTKARKGLYKCGACKKQFTAKINTILESSHIPVSKWLFAFWLMNSSKKGVSANQLSRQLGITYKSAWFMCHRIRYAMSQPPLSGKLGHGGGIIEVDKTYIGGKARNNPHRGKKKRRKPIVVTLVHRDGKARTFPMPSAKKGPLQALIRLNVEGSAHIMTNSHKSYVDLGYAFASHGAVDHSKEFVRGIIHTNFAESYHSLVKRAIIGAFHHVSEKHLPRYLREFEHRWNHRHISDGERTEIAIRRSRGKRLVYREPVKRGRPTLKRAAQRDRRQSLD